jgi:hypothetical protein
MLSHPRLLNVSPGESRNGCGRISVEDGDWEAEMAPLTDVMKFLEIATVSAFRAEWEQLSEAEQQQLREGIGNGSYTY